MTFTPKRAQQPDNGSVVKQLTDLHAKGHKTLVVSALKTFNSQMAIYCQGGGFFADNDEIGPAEFQESEDLDE